MSCEALPSTGTLRDLTDSATLLRELIDVIAAALAVPTRVVDNINVALPTSTSSRAILQTSNLEITVRLFQDEASQPLGTGNVAALVRPRLT